LEKFSRACWSFCAVEGAKHKFQGVQVKYWKIDEFSSPVCKCTVLIQCGSAHEYIQPWTKELKFVTFMIGSYKFMVYKWK
jgi:hypothetical protein